MADVSARSDALGSPLARFTGWHLSIACSACRVLVQLRVSDLDATLPEQTMGHVVERLRCSRCGSQPSSVVLADGAAGMGRAEVRRVQLMEPEKVEGLVGPDGQRGP